MKEDTSRVSISVRKMEWFIVNTHIMHTDSHALLSLHICDSVTLLLRETSRLFLMISKTECLLNVSFANLQLRNSGRVVGVKLSRFSHANLFLSVFSGDPGDSLGMRLNLW